MGGEIIGALCSFLCALPFLIAGIFMKKGSEPINFWSGDYSLKDKVKDIPSYNAEMSALYLKYGLSFLLASVLFFFAPIAAMIIIGLCCSVGVFLVYRKYKQILGKYS